MGVYFGFTAVDLIVLLSLQRLSELLKSKKPEDLQEANRLIKNMVKEVCQCQMKCFCCNI